jgi:predicted DNA-binding transcriptional regulator AlpA
VDNPVLIPLKEVERRTGLSRVSIYKLEKAGRFPRRVILRPKGIGAVAEGLAVA